ncbi:MAG TPA: hypothetical protein VK902_15115 [Rubrobacter sp.]|nr:hypothetical protein [Rubrobacter sp.]
MPEDIERDAGGFVVAGNDFLGVDGTLKRWPLDRQPLLLVSGLPGVFAAGDVRHRSVKRMASAVG